MKVTAQIRDAAAALEADRKLAPRITAILTALATAVILAAVWAAIAMNSAALGIESGIIEKEFDRIVLKTLNEQKSVALWDEPLERIAQGDLDWVDEEIGTYLSGTYGHDLVIILDGNGRIVYEHGRKASSGAGFRALAAAKPLLAEVRGGPLRRWTKRDRNFATQEASDSALAGAAKLRAGANVLKLSGEPAVISAMTFTPTHDLSLVSKKPPVIVSVLRLTPDRLHRMGDDVNVRNLHLIPRSSDMSDGLITLQADDGQAIGSLAWMPQLPGKAFLTVLLPVLVLVTLGGALTGHFMVAKIAVLAGRLRLSADEARRLAYEDQITGLPNRRAFRDNLAGWCAAQERPFIVALVDIDRFKEVNDPYGHETGDRLIEAVSARLKEELGGWGLAARLGGDEFAIIGPSNEDCEVGNLKRRLGKLFEDPFQLGPYRILSSASLGLCVVTDADTRPSSVLRDADTALYEAKSRGRRQGVIYSVQMSNAARTRRLIERDLQEAVDNNDLYLAYQPVQSLASGALDEVEALVRWRHPQLGDLSPEAFVPIAEQSNLIVSLGQAVFRMALHQLEKWPEMHISINLSPRELRSNQFLRLVRSGCREHGIAPNRITFEVTEGVAIDDSGKANLLLQSLRAIGFRVALDDFGTGYASLSFLRTYPLDRVKLDRSLLLGAGTDNAATAVFEGAVSIGRQLGLEVVAEGIESEEQLELVRKAGCTHVQGYLLSSPLSPEEVERHFNINCAEPNSQRFERRQA